MDNTKIKTELWKQVERLPFDLQRRVLDFAKALGSTLSRGVEGKSLLGFSGIIGQKEADEWRAAIDDACGRVDENGW